MQTHGLKDMPMTVTKVTLVDSPEKMRKQNSGWSILIPQEKDTMPLSEQNLDKKKSHLGVNYRKS